MKNQKKTRERPTQGRGATLIITEMAVFTLETDYSCEMGYPFDNLRLIGNTSSFENVYGFKFEWTIRLTLSVNFDGQFEDGLSVSDSLCRAAPSPQKKSEKGCLWGRGWLYTGQSQTDNPFLALVWKRPITKFPHPVFLMIAKDCRERLSAFALSIGLSIPRG